MMGVTRALRRNGHIPAMGGRRGPGRQRPWCVDDGKNRDLMTALDCEKKRDKKRSDVELWRESAYDSDGIELHTGLYVPGLRYTEKS